MKLLLLGLFLTFALASDVVVLTDADWEDAIQEHEVALVKFYAPWYALFVSRRIATRRQVVFFNFRCGHCKRMAPEFEKAATKLKSNDPPVSLIKVSANISRILNKGLNRLG